MSTDFLIRNWALVAGSVLGVAIGLFVLYRLYQASRGAKLSAAVRVLRQRRLDASKAAQRLDKATAKLASLKSRADSVRPRALSEADEAVQDTAALKKIADDLVLVAIKVVREVIVEEFPPNRQDGLRTRYL